MHALWYILLRERNVLLTQREEARRIRLDLKGFSAAADKLRMVGYAFSILLDLVVALSGMTADTTRCCRCRNRWRG